MRIGLIDADSKIPNLALMKISAWHKQNGDSVKWWNAFEKFDQVYASQIFTKTKFGYYPPDVIKGGSGLDLSITLPHEIEHIYPDYTLYNIDYAMGFLTRGCINACPFCIVPTKEGKLHRHAELSEFWNGQKRILLLDNAITDFPEIIPDLEFIRDHQIQINITQGLNVRTISQEMANLLGSLKLWPHEFWHISWDSLKDEKRILAGIERLNLAGIRNQKIMCFILSNFNSSLEDDLYRIKLIDSLKINPFLMIYNREHASNDLLKLGRWCNRPEVRKSVTFEKWKSLNYTRNPALF